MRRPWRACLASFAAAALAEVERQGPIGTLLASAIISSWLVLHISMVFFLLLSTRVLLAAPLIVLVICWLNVGLFIIAHDAMHGSLVPGLARRNLWFGRVALGLYAGFRFDRLKRLHMQHHGKPGSPEDPDFHAHEPTRFWRWYLAFMRRYLGLTEILVLSVAVGVYLLIGARLPNLLLFWALPAILSSLQLFYFGTYLPHRHDGRSFADKHNARTNQFSWLLSLLTCFHFGYHHEHHLSPHVPWWRLPAERRARARIR